MRPHVFLTARESRPLRSIHDVRRAITDGAPATLWDSILAAVENDLVTEPLTPATPLPHRRPPAIERANRDFTICHATGQRVLRAALAALLTGDRRFADGALRQLRVLFGGALWSDWRDLSHLQYEADLRTGMLSRDCALAYDWLHPLLTPDERRLIVDGIDTHGVQPFWRAVRQKAWWVDAESNWTTCVVGGLGIAGMALGADHPDSGRLIAFSLPRMERYLSFLGPEGEFNESVGYASAMRLVAMYYLAHWYATAGEENRLRRAPFPDAARWYVHLTFPPGRTAGFGDAARAAPPDPAWVSAVASATGDGVLAWFAANHPYPSEGTHRAAPLELLWSDPDLTSISPEGRLPRGRAFGAYGACVSSRTNWDPAMTPMAVYGKAGVEPLHQHHDAGHVCIDAYGKELIVDLHSPPGYPLDFFGKARYRYYNASSWGHNILNFGDREMVAEPGTIAPFLGTEFDDRLGGWWRIDLSGLYSGVESVRRTVIHLNPVVCAVLDEARSRHAEDIVLRWHTADACEPTEDGSFVVSRAGVHLSSRVVRVDGAAPAITNGCHEYTAPFDRCRLGDLLEQRHESYVEARVAGGPARLLTLFAAFPEGSPPTPWVTEASSWQIDTGAGSVRVTVGAEEIAAVNELTGLAWTVDLR